VRVQNVGLSTVLLGQGVPFMQAGSDLLRSKSFDRDSYNSGDWFNKLDFTYQDNNFGVGLPVAGKNQDNWYLMGPRLADPALTPGAEDIMFSAGLFQELLAIRDSSPLFHLQTAEEVQARVMFHNTGPSQLPGLIVMTISDMVEPDLDANMEQMVVLINANDEAQSFTLASAAGSYLDPHRVQQNSVDPLVKMASFDQASGTFYVPGRTAVVFVEYTPQARIEFLIDDVEALVTAGVLNDGQGNALIAKLEGALVKLNDGQAHVSINRLQAFVNQVYDFVEDGILSPSQGQDLMDKANSIINQIDDLY
jgi:pullulanase